MIKVAITGASGLIGSRITELLNDSFHFIPLRQDFINITDKDNVWNVLKDTDFDILLHLAAYTNVDGAETEKEKAYALNVLGTKHILDAVDKLQKKLVYVSTDFVFDGAHPPYTEKSIPAPVSYYGQTKFEGEQLVQNNAMIVRPSYPYRAYFPEKKRFCAYNCLSLKR